MSDKSNERMLITWLSLIALIIMALTVAAGFFVGKSEKTKENPSYTYAIIFYPDTKTSVEGYVDKFSWGEGVVKVTIDGEEYITSSENVVIIKRKDLVVNKEDNNNDERNDDRDNQ